MVEGAGQAFFIATGWALAGLIGSIPMLYLIRWWSEGMVTGAEMAAIGFIFLMMLALMFTPLHFTIKAAFFVLLFCASIGLPFITGWFSKRDDKALIEEKEAIYRTAIAANPDNMAAHSALARSLYAQGRMSEAIEEMEKTVQLSPRHCEEERYLLEHWKREQEGLLDLKMICRSCREETLKDRPFCTHCGHPVSAARELKDAMLEDLSGTLKSVMLILPIAIIGAGLASLLRGFLGNLMILLFIVAGLLWIHRRIQYQ